MSSKSVQYLFGSKKKVILFLSIPGPDRRKEQEEEDEILSVGG